MYSGREDGCRAKFWWAYFLFLFLLFGGGGVGYGNAFVNWTSIANIVVNSPRTRYFPSITLRNASNTGSLIFLLGFLDA